jgi:hypothetical protein
MSSYTAARPITSSQTARSKRVSMERLRNWYAEPAPAGGKGAVTLYPTPGLTLFATVGDGPIRGMIEMAGYLFVVSGQELYSVDNTGTAALIATIAGTGHCYMATNGVHVVICTSGASYAATLTTLTSLPENNLNGVAYSDGYGVFSQRGGQLLWRTDVDDMTTIGGLSFTSVDRTPGNCQGLAAVRGEIWAFKSDSTEILQHTGAPVFPFERATVIERGCIAPGSIANGEHTVLWLADDLTVRMAQGYEPAKVSTVWVENLIADVSDPASAIGFVYRQAGRQFYVLSFYDLTIAYDLTTGLWHERVSTGLDRWRVREHARSWLKEYVGDSEDGKLYELDLTEYTDNGATIRRELRAPPLFAEGRRVRLDELYVDFDAGTGLNDGQGSDPQAILDWTEDGGHAWSNVRYADIGKIGVYGRRATWNRLGMFRERTLRVAVTDPVNAVVKGVYLRAEAIGV